MRDRFTQGNAPRLYKLQKEIAKFSQGQLSVSSYFTKFKILWDEFVNYQPFPTCTCTCGAQRSQLDVQQKDHVLHFLMGLPSISKVFLVFQQEKRRHIGQETEIVVEAITLYANNSNHPKGYQCYQGGNQNYQRGNHDH